MSVSGHGSGEAIEVVTAFENRYQPASGVFVRDRTHHGGEFGEISVRQNESAERVSSARIESRGNQQEIGAELIHSGGQLIPESAEDFVFAGARRERAIERASLAGAFSGFAGVPC